MMRILILFSTLLITLAPGLSFGVRVAKCPNSFEINYDHYLRDSLIDNDPVIKALEQEIGDTVYGSWQAMEDLTFFASSKTFQFVLDNTTYGQCHYRGRHRSNTVGSSETYSAATLGGTDKKPRLKIFMTVMNSEDSTRFGELHRSARFVIDTAVFKYGKEFQWGKAAFEVTEKSSPLSVKYLKRSNSESGSPVSTYVTIGSTSVQSAKPIRVENPDNKPKTPKWHKEADELIESTWDIHEGVSYMDEDGNVTEQCSFAWEELVNAHGYTATDDPENQGQYIVKNYEGETVEATRHQGIVHHTDTDTYRNSYTGKFVSADEVIGWDKVGIEEKNKKYYWSRQEIKDPQNKWMNVYVATLTVTFKGYNVDEKSWTRCDVDYMSWGFKPKKREPVFFDDDMGAL